MPLIITALFIEVGFLWSMIREGPAWAWFSAKMCPLSEGLYSCGLSVSELNCTQSFKILPVLYGKVFMYVGVLTID